MNDPSVSLTVPMSVPMIPMLAYSMGLKVFESIRKPLISVWAKDSKYKNNDKISETTKPVFGMVILFGIYQTNFFVHEPIFAKCTY
ncbi:hypothetical protein [Allomuricauda sp. SCSIO 65647]|uniref:hypothetical protein n=1 Tax=Allomuricauda sp. SCSIO 65647 TaxID=2908843 RepID=UPI001F26DBBA|nr:hypothetical protein [Muricauda sp. SCSIO 65647]UJH67136.1 hypothetical protein L0P89_14435 [Muricauda sp. SCSIO 65647]